MSKACLCCSLVLVAAMTCSAAAAGVFDLGEIPVSPSPSEAAIIEFRESEKILDFDVARGGLEAAVLVQDAAGGSKIVFWNIGSPGSAGEWIVPKGFIFRSVAWHPLGGIFFLSGLHGGEHVIARVDRRGDTHTFRMIYRTSREIRRLVAGPRPYSIFPDPRSETARQVYRLFFGIRNQDGTWAVRSITEEGARDYQAIGPKKGFTTFRDAGEQPSRLEASWALPLAFHPAGHILLWEDEKNSFHLAFYERDHWGRKAALSLNGGTVTPTPNGLALIHWQPGTAGVAVVAGRSRKRDLQASEYTFAATPSSVPDGRGIVGLVKKNGRPTLVYVPIRVPLADVANAWMFAQSGQDEESIERNGGLFRDLPDDQLYSLYETEGYQGGAYDPSTPTRPYLVTTDIFWELLSAAYEGLFIVAERLQAIPAFWGFVNEAESFFRRSDPGSRWAGVFSVVARMGKPSGEKESETALRPEVRAELELIRKAEGPAESPLLGATVDYGELKPRGHYTSSPAMSAYFKAFKYLTALAGDASLPEGDAGASSEQVRFLGELGKVSPEAKARALEWIGAYERFIPPSRSPLVLADRPVPFPPYAKHPLNRPRIFPLAWGFDNEVLLSTVYHEFWPETEQIKGPAGLRLVPSGLDVAAAVGSRFAAGLLAGEMEKYPPLGAVMEDLQARWRAGGEHAAARGNLYDRWMDALAVQWADDVAAPDGARNRGLWNVKRLQTGLASWATLRHATVLVNERTVAESGEGAFEPILFTPPRGYVEPDPDTFHALAGLFRSMEQMVGTWKLLPEGGTIQADDAGLREALKAGISRRLRETAEKAGLFEKIARKELAGEPLTGGEYEEILYVGRIAEHHFLIFKSLASEEYALSNPDPMPKIADVAGGGPYGVPFLMAAVGRPMEWNQVVPYFGRKEMVKGSVYSYYEFESGSLLNDREWLDTLPARRHPQWVSPFVSGSAAPCPPQSPY